MLFTPLPSNLRPCDGTRLSSGRPLADIPHLQREALAWKIGSTPSAICRYERHPANLTLSTWEKVARATGRRLVVKFA